MTAAFLTIRLAVVLQCVGLLRIAYVDGTALGTTLFMTLRWPESSTLVADHGVAWFATLCAVSLLVRPTRAAAGIVAAWFIVIAALTVYQGGDFGSEYALFAHATRYGAAILAFVGGMSALAVEVRERWFERLARLAVALTFAAHGLEALESNPRFIDFVITAFRRIDVSISEATTRHLLVVIGLHDWVLAVLILAKRWRWVAGYMAFWGALTAGSRVVHMGFVKWPATLVRAANAGVPLALYFMWRPSSPVVQEDA